MANLALDSTALDRAIREMVGFHPIFPEISIQVGRMNEVRIGDFIHLYRTPDNARHAITLLLDQAHFILTLNPRVPSDRVFWDDLPGECHSVDLSRSVLLDGDAFFTMAARSDMLTVGDFRSMPGRDYSEELDAHICRSLGLRCDLASQLLVDERPGRPIPEFVCAVPQYDESGAIMRMAVIDERDKLPQPVPLTDPDREAAAAELGAMLIWGPEGRFTSKSSGRRFDVCVSEDPSPRIAAGGVWFLVDSLEAVFETRRLDRGTVEPGPRTRIQAPRDHVRLGTAADVVQLARRDAGRRETTALREMRATVARAAWRATTPATPQFSPTQYS